MGSPINECKKQNRSIRDNSIMEHSFSTDKNDSDNEANGDCEKKLQVTKSINTSPKKVMLKPSLFPSMDKMGPTDEELEFREKKMNEPTVLEKSKKFYKCTKCNKNYQTAIKNNQNISVHPFLGVLMCEDCCNFYEDGDFSLDSDGEDKYCRWCGEGGSILSCSRCIYGFCSACVKKHFGAKKLKEIKEDDDWLCFACNVKPLWYLRFVCSLSKMETEITEVSTEKDSTQKTKSIHSKRKQDAPKKADQKMSATTSILKRRKIYTSTDSEESDEDDFMNSRKKLKLSFGSPNQKESNLSSKPQMLEKLGKILKLVEYQMSFGLNWSTKLLTKLTQQKSINTENDFIKECQKIKWFLSLMSTHLSEFCSTIESVEKNLPKEGKDNENLIRTEEEDRRSDLSSYTDILLFLGFLTNQVKLFMNEGISVQSLLKAEIINEEEVIGIRKKNNSQTCESTKDAAKATPKKVLKNDRNHSKPQPKICDEDETNNIYASILKTLEVEESGNEKGSQKLKSPSALDVIKKNLCVTNENGDNYEKILAILENE